MGSKPSLSSGLPGWTLSLYDEVLQGCFWGKVSVVSPLLLGELGSIAVTTTSQLLMLKEEFKQQILIIASQIPHAALKQAQRAGESPTARGSRTRTTCWRLWLCSLGPNRNIFCVLLPFPQHPAATLPVHTLCAELKGLSPGWISELQLFFSGYNSGKTWPEQRTSYSSLDVKDNLDVITWCYFRKLSIKSGIATCN